MSYHAVRVSGSSFEHDCSLRLIIVIVFFVLLGQRDPFGRGQIQLILCRFKTGGVLMENPSNHYHLDAQTGAGSLFIWRGFNGKPLEPRSIVGDCVWQIAALWVMVSGQEADIAAL